MWFGLLLHHFSSSLCYSSNVTSLGCTIGWKWTSPFFSLSSWSLWAFDCSSTTWFHFHPPHGQTWRQSEVKYHFMWARSSSRSATWQLCPVSTTRIYSRISRLPLKIPTCLTILVKWTWTLYFMVHRLNPSSLKVPYRRKEIYTLSTIVRRTASNESL